MEEKVNSNAATGNVYMFNVGNSDLQVIANGMAAGGIIAGWSMTGSNKYQPQGQAVPRTLNASDSPGKFFNGTNSVTLQTDFGASRAQVGIDGGQIPLNQDLLLFIQLNQWALVNQSGVQVEAGPVTSSGG